MGPGGCGGRCIDNNLKIATDDRKCCYHICDECFARLIGQDKEVGEDRGLGTQEKRRGVGEKRAAGGSSKRQGTREAGEMEGIN